MKPGELRRKTPWRPERKPLARQSARRTARIEEEQRWVIRALVFARDRDCQLRDLGPCAGGPTFHHRRKEGRGGAYTVANGALLCAHHNTLIEHDADVAREAHTRGLVVRLGDPEWDALGHQRATPVAG